MKTHIVCPICYNAYLTYYKRGAAYNSLPVWVCSGCLAFSRSRFNGMRIEIESVNRMNKYGNVFRVDIAR